MPDPLTPLPAEPRRGSIVAAWDRFFFAPGDPRPLALIRITTGLLLLWSLGWLATDLRGFLGSAGWVDQSALNEMRSRAGSREWSLWNLVPDGALGAAWAGAMAVIALFTLGLFSRVTAPLAWAIAVSTTRRNPFILFGFDQMLTLWLFYLAATFSSGRAYSIDAWMTRRRGGPDRPSPTIGAHVGIRLFQVTLAIIYGSAGLAKLRGFPWWDGTALIRNLGNAEFRPFDLTWLLKSETCVYLLYLLTHLALWVEILYPVLIWKPAFRRPMLVAVVLMHAGIALTLGLTEFSLGMLAGNLAFVRLGDGRGAPGAVESAQGMAPASAPGLASHPHRRARR